MRTEEEIRARNEHPAGKGLATEVAPPAPEQGIEGSPYREFIEALADLESSKLLYGAGSIEATMSRSRVQQLRERAIDAWRQAQAA